MRRWPFLVGALLAGCATAPPPQDPAPLPDIRHGHCIVPLRGGLLCLGGYARRGDDERGARQTFWLADGSSQWQPRAPMLQGRTFFVAAVVDGTAYAIGDGVERFDVKADRWTPLVAPGALPKSHFAACAHDGDLFVLGGFPTERATLRKVDVTTGSVTVLDNPPGFAPGDHFHLLASLGGELHAIGGLDGVSFQPRAEHHVLRGGVWTTLPPPPVGMWTKFAAHAVHDGRLFVFGDFGGWCLHPESGTWSQRAPMPLMVAMPATVARGDDLWVIGGMAVQGPRNLLLRHSVARDEWHDELLVVEPPGQDR